MGIEAIPVFDKPIPRGIEANELGIVAGELGNEPLKTGIAAWELGNEALKTGIAAQELGIEALHLSTEFFPDSRTLGDIVRSRPTGPTGRESIAQG